MISDWSVRNSRIRIDPSHFGHTNGSTSNIRLINAAHLLEAFLFGSASDVEIVEDTFSLLRVPLARQEYHPKYLVVDSQRFAMCGERRAKRGKSGFPVQGEVGESDILIGHSVGAPFVCRVLEHAERCVNAAFLVCPFARQLGNKQFDPYNETLVRDPFDWAYIRSRAKLFFTYATTNDPYVPLSHSKEVSGALSTELKIIDGGGHLNSESGYTTAPFLEGELGRMVGDG